MSKRSGGGPPTGAIITLAIIVIVACFFGGFLVSGQKRVEPSHVGLVVSNAGGGAGQQQRGANLKVVYPGFVRINPVTQKFVQYPLQQQTLNLVRQGDQSDLSVSCQDKGLITFNVDASTQWRVNPEKVTDIYTLRPNMPLVADGDGDIESQVVKRDVVNAVTLACTKFSYDEAFTAKRGEFAALIQQYAQAELASSNIIVDKVTVGQIHLRPAQEQAIQQRNEAEQAAIRAGFLKQQRENEANAAVAKAEGDKQVAIREAQAQAEAIGIVNQALSTNPKYLEWLAISQWNGCWRPEKTGDGSSRSC